MNEEVILKDGSSPEDPRLDRLIQFDEESRKFPLTDIMPTQKPRSYTWRCTPRYDQGREGACVGFGIGHELAARPAEVMGLTESYLIQGIYWEAQKRDQFPGGAYPGANPRTGGTSVLAGAKVVLDLGYIEAYRWTFNLNDLILGVGYNGPAVMGLHWYEGMYQPDVKGFVYPKGRIVGGHCFLTRGVDITRKSFLCRNSWGINWGMGGDFFISFEDMDQLLHQNGEACFFIGRKSVNQPLVNEK